MYSLTQVLYLIIKEISQHFLKAKLILENFFRKITYPLLSSLSKSWSHSIIQKIRSNGVKLLGLYNFAQVLYFIHVLRLCNQNRLFKCTFRSKFSKVLSAKFWKDLSLDVALPICSGGKIYTCN